MSEKLFRITSMVLLCLAIIHQLWRSHCTPTMCIDSALQICGAESIRAGEGYTERFAHAKDLAQTSCHWQVLWPPGYSLLMAGCFAFTDDYVVADECLRAISIISLFFTYYALLTVYPLAGGQKSVVLFLLMSWAVGQPPFYLQRAPELLALAFYTGAVYLILGLLSKSGKSLALGSVFASVLLLGAAYCRYAYWPLCAICPAVLFVWGAKFDRRYLTAGIISISVIFTGLSSLSVLNKIKSGHITYLSTRDQNIPKKIWWSNLLLTEPDFPQVAIINRQLWEGLKSRNLESVSLTARWLTSIAILLCFIVISTIWIRGIFASSVRSSESKQGQSMQAFWLIGALTVALTLVLLAVLSVRIPPQEVTFLPPPRTLWVYLAESRYYAPMWIFFLFAIVNAAFTWRPHKGVFRIFQYSIRVVLLCLFLHSVREERHLFNWQWASGWNPTSVEPEEQAVIDAINHLKKNKIPVIVVSNFRSLGDLLTGAYRLLGPPSAGPIIFETSAPVSILFEAWKPGTVSASESGPSYEQVVEVSQRCQARPVWSDEKLSLWMVERWGPAKLVK